MRFLATPALRACALTALPILAAACSGSDGGPAAETGSIQLSVTPSSLSVQHGGSASLTVSLTRGGGFDGAVTLSVAGLPAGVTTRIAPTQLSGSVASSTVLVSVPPTVTPGSYTATFTVSGEGVPPATAAAELTVSAVPTYALRLTPAALTIQPGETGESAVAIDRTNFDGAVSLEVANLPAGVTAVFTPASATGSSSTVAVSVSAGVLPGTYPMTIRGTASGPGVRTATLTVTVPTPPAYTLNVSPAALSLQRGGGAIVSITIARTNFTGAVDLTLGTLAPGITGTLVPGSTTGTTSQLELQVASGVPAGFYQIALRGTAAGLTDRVAFLQLNVTATAPGGGNVEYQFCDASVVPVFLAYQDGTGTWQPVTGFTSGGATTFSFNLTQGRGGVLVVFRTLATVVAGAPSGSLAERSAARARRSRVREVLRAGATDQRLAASPARASAADVYLTELLYGTTAELAQDGTDYCGVTQPTKTVTGTVAGLAFGQFGVLSMGPSTELFIAGTSRNPVTFTGVPLGRVDLVATRLTDPGAPPDKLILVRDLDIPNGGSLPATIDFNAASASAPATATATIGNGGGDDLEIFTELVTANSQGVVWFDLAPDATATRPWAGVPAASMRSGDFHGLYVFGTSPSSDLDFRVALRFVGPVMDQSLALGPVIAPPQTSQVAAGDYPRFRFRGSFPAAYDRGASIDVAGPQGGGNVFSVLATRAWLTVSGSGTEYDFTMPDVSGLAGFPVAARLTAGANDVVAEAFGFTGAGVFDPKPALGGEFRSAAKGAGITVP